MREWRGPVAGLSRLTHNLYRLLRISDLASSKYPQDTPSARLEYPSVCLCAIVCVFVCVCVWLSGQIRMPRQVRDTKWKMENQQRYFPANFNNHFRLDFLPHLSHSSSFFHSLPFSLPWLSAYLALVQMMFLRLSGEPKRGRAGRGRNFSCYRSVTSSNNNRKTEKERERGEFGGCRGNSVNSSYTLAASPPRRPFVNYVGETPQAAQSEGMEVCTPPPATPQLHPLLRYLTGCFCYYLFF